jgi:hypothetical protein
MSSTEVARLPSGLERLEPISLEETNRRAGLLKRVDKKFVLNSSAIEQLAENLADHYKVLEINGLRSFKYLSWSNMV